MRVRQATSPHDWMASRSPASDHVNSVDQVRPKRPSSAMGSRIRRAPARPSIGRSQIPWSARLTRSTRISMIDVPVGSTVARRMTSRSSAIGQEQPPATSTATSRDAVPSSDPTRTIRPNGPAANDSAGRSMDRTSRSPSRPIATRWPRRSPAPSTTGSWRNHGTLARSPRSAGRASPAAAAMAPGGPAQARGAHGRTAAPAVADATSPTAPMATTPGPIQRSHRDSTIRVASSGGWDSWREEGEAPILAGDPYRGLTCSGSDAPLPLSGLDRVGARAVTMSGRWSER